MVAGTVSYPTAPRRRGVDDGGMRSRTITDSRRYRVAFGAALVLLAAVVPAAVPSVQAAVLPRVTPVVECKLAATAADPFDVYWFGYRSDATYWRLPGVLNAIVEKNAGGTVVNATANRGQVVQFKTGERRRAFAVRVAPGNRPEWSVTVAVTLAEGTNPAATAVAIPSGATPLCSPRTPRHSATAQVAAVPTITFEAIGRRLDGGNRLIGSTVRFTVNGVASTCQTGSPMPPQVLWGYAAGPGVKAVKRSSVVRTDVLTVAFQDSSFRVPFVRTWTDRLALADPQQVSTNNLGESFRGVAAASVIADVYARCKVNGKVITAAEPLWVAITGEEVPFFWYTDATQHTVATPCEPSGADVPGCPFPGGSNPGGGQRAKR